MRSFTSVRSILGKLFFLLCIFDGSSGYSDIQCADGVADCCDISDVNSCTLSTLSSEKSTLVFPGGDTSCISSNSTPFAFRKSFTKYYHFRFIKA